jgi:hypothetical protein
VGLQISTNVVVLRGPSGFTAEFTGTSMSPGASWDAPAGMNATLTRRSDQSWRLESHGSGEIMDFTAGGS